MTFSLPAELSHLLPVRTLAFGMPSGYEWIVVGLIALLIFGKRLPGAARGIGEAFREFKRGIKLDVNPSVEVAELQRSARHD